ncbi:hypothetical protein AVEN_48923-1 [Araneus ventricosus]|uniref:Uncharacterized protein n=1 Tax=Araneus ventricosus TaxID=182803 RepID=A0A4Y2AI78_ARAVE|nr:hypothetical protein AVEN_48923-1 [Araneus ventricosus]
MNLVLTPNVTPSVSNVGPNQSKEIEPINRIVDTASSSSISRLLIGSSESSSSCIYTIPAPPRPSSIILASASRPDSHDKLALLKISSASCSK